jgi:2-phospho-L-lactate guanylyltransferase
MTGLGLRAVIPMKPVARCKLRLASALEPRQRACLVLWMLEHVATAALRAMSIADVVVLGGDEPVQALCRSVGVRWLPDPIMDLNAALGDFYRQTCDATWTGLIFLAGDLPMVDAAAIDAIVAGPDQADLVLATGARGGTNAILCRCGVAFHFELGTDSFQRHLAQAGVLGITVRQYESAATFMDLDTPEDLEQLLKEIPDLLQQAGRLEHFLPRVAM